MSHIENLEGRQLFAGGALDTTYATNGAATLTFRRASDTETVVPTQVMADSTGRSYVVARTSTTLQIQRLTAAGALDTGWGKRGALVFVTGNNSGVDKARIDAGGRLLVLDDNTLYRFTAAGALDTTFGTNGSVGVSGVFAAANDFDVDGFNRIYVTGDVATKTKYLDRTGVIRLISKGRLDKAFQGKGVYVVPTGTYMTSGETQSSGQAVRVLADNSVVVAGTVGYGTQNGSLLPLYNGVRSLKFTADGVLDTTYGQSGVATTVANSNTDNNTYGILVLGVRANGAVVLDDQADNYEYGGLSNVNSEIAADGEVPSFDESGFAYRDPDTYGDGATAGTFTTLSDGRELAVLNGTDEYQSTVSVLTAGGVYDRTFNAGNPITLAAGHVGAGGFAAAGTPDDAILTARTGSLSTDVTVNRFLTTGSGTSPVAHTPAQPPAAGGSKLTTARTSYQFNADFSAKGGDTIDASSITSDVLRIFAADGTHRVPRLISVSASGRTVVATFRTTDVNGGAWDASDNGSYAIRLIGGQVRESDGTTLATQTIGGITVKIA